MKFATVLLLLPLCGVASFVPYYDSSDMWYDGNTFYYAVAGEYEDTKCNEFKKAKHRRACECYWVSRSSFECKKEGFSWDHLTLQPSKAPTTVDQITPRPTRQPRPPTPFPTKYPTRPPTIPYTTLLQQLEALTEEFAALNNTAHLIATCAKKKCLKKKGLSHYKGN